MRVQIANATAVQRTSLYEVEYFTVGCYRGCRQVGELSEEFFAVFDRAYSEFTDDVGMDQNQFVADKLCQ